MEYHAIIIGDLWQPGYEECVTTRTISTVTDAEAIELIFSDGDFARVLDAEIWRREYSRHEESNGDSRVYVSTVRETVIREFTRPDADDILARADIA